MSPGNLPKPDDVLINRWDNLDRQCLGYLKIFNSAKIPRIIKYPALRYCVIIVILICGDGHWSKSKNRNKKNLAYFDRLGSKYLTG